MASARVRVPRTVRIRALCQAVNQDPRGGFLGVCVQSVPGGRSRLCTLRWPAARASAGHYLPTSYRQRLGAAASRTHRTFVCYKWPRHRYISSFRFLVSMRTRKLFQPVRIDLRMNGRQNRIHYCPSRASFAQRQFKSRIQIDVVPLIVITLYIFFLILSTIDIRDIICNKSIIPLQLFLNFLKAFLWEIS